MQGELKTVFHVHTHYSDDSNAAPEDILAGAREAGVDCVAITDHDAIEGAIRLAELAGRELKVVVGEEISTAEGHLIGLFLSRWIPPDLPARETAERIRAQGGLVVVPHPFNTIFGCSLRQAVYDLLELIDVVEVCNAQNLSPLPNRRAEAFAREHGFPRIVGADAHHRGHLAPCYQWMPDFEDAASFLTALGSARLVPGRHPLRYFVRSAEVCLRGMMGWRLPPGYGTKCTTRRPKFETGRGATQRERQLDNATPTLPGSRSPAADTRAAQSSTKDTSASRRLSPTRAT